MTTSVKTCFKCDKEKPLDEFYRHPQMADGRVNKCKECNKQDVRENRAKRRDYYVWYERIRSMEPHRIALRQEQKRRMAENPLSKQRRQEWGKRNTPKRYAHTLVARAIKTGILERKPCEVCGAPDSEAHHDDYSKPLDVRWLCPKHHGEHHRNRRWFGEEIPAAVRR